MSDVEKLRNHIKNFTVKQLKKEILLVKREFNVSALKRDQVKAVILSYPYHFKHLLNKRGDMKPKGVPLITTWKKPKNMKIESMNFTLPTTPKKKKPIKKNRFRGYTSKICCSTIIFSRRDTKIF